MSFISYSCTDVKQFSPNLPGLSLLIIKHYQSLTQLSGFHLPETLKDVQALLIAALAAWRSDETLRVNFLSYKKTA